MATKSLNDLSRKDLLRTKAFIDGSWVPAISGKTFAVLNPATIEELAVVPEMSAADTQLAIDAAHTAFKTYKRTSARQRSQWLRNWSRACLDNAADLALLLSLENGKPLVEAHGEILYATSFLDWFAGEAERVYGEVIPPANLGQRILTIKQPLGVAACLAPWNFPIAMITRKCGAALAAGCTAVLKPAGETPLSCLAVARLAEEAGFPQGCINVVTTMGYVAEIGELLCSSSLVRKLSFTGSTRVGKLLARQCSGGLKKLSLELGGNSPFIVFEDADISKAVEACILAKFRNSGQTCVTANRVFVHEAVHHEFLKALTRRVRMLKVGAGTEPDVMVGPLTHERAVDKAMAHIENAKRHGAQVVLGGGSVKNVPGYFFQPTIITGMTDDMVITREETFAPVIGLYKFSSEEEVISRANNCDVGLGGFVCTENMARMWRVTEALEVGMVGVNLGMLSACESPFGGIKESGYGREGGRHGIDEYLAVKSILINVAP